MPKANPPKPKQKPARRRAKNSDGTFKANDPSTPENEAWEPIELETEKTAGKYSIKPKVTGTSEGQTGAGKYANNKANEVRPKFEGIRTTYH